MDSLRNTVIQNFNKRNPQVKLSYQLFDFPSDDMVFTPLNAGLMIAHYSQNKRIQILNATFKKGTGLDKIEGKLIVQINKLLGLK